MILRMGAPDSGGMNVALLFFACRHLRISNRWESTWTSLVDASAREARSLDGREATIHRSFRLRYWVTQETEPMKNNGNLMGLMCMLREIDSGFSLYSYS
jgi:hypothetical protein